MLRFSVTSQQHAVACSKKTFCWIKTNTIRLKWSRTDTCKIHSRYSYKSVKNENNPHYTSRFSELISLISPRVFPFRVMHNHDQNSSPSQNWWNITGHKMKTKVNYVALTLCVSVFQLTLVVLPSGTDSILYRLLIFLVPKLPSNFHCLGFPQSEKISKAQNHKCPIFLAR
jgi:hypothetical protein